MLLFFMLLLFALLFFLYQRYFPIRHVPNLEELSESSPQNIVYLDVRDYQAAFGKPFQGAVNLPYPYLKRYYEEISSCQVVVIASDPVLKNLTIRFLRGHGFKVVGYQLIK